MPIGGRPPDWVLSVLLARARHDAAKPRGQAHGHDRGVHRRCARIDIRSRRDRATIHVPALQLGRMGLCKELPQEGEFAHARPRS